MPIVAAALLYVGHLLRKPMDARLKRRQGGPFLLVVLAAVVLALWARGRPSGLAVGYVAGETAGVLATYLLSGSLVLATRARWLEPWFGGLDRMYRWHKGCAVVALVALIPHVLLTGRSLPTTTDLAVGSLVARIGTVLGSLSLLGLLALVAVSLPHAGRILRLPYHRWLFVHRLTGLFVLIALVHGLILYRLIGYSALLTTVYTIIGSVGTVAYAYAELLMRRRAPTGDYTVERVERPSAEILDLRLAPVGRRIAPRPGQFIFLRIGGDDAWREHPFSVAGIAPDGSLRLTVRSLGRDTARMHARLTPGLPATVTGPYGMFDYTLGGAHQVWIAGGIGVAPFLGWLAALHPQDPYRIDLFYSTPTEADAVFLAELRTAQRRLAPLLRLHPAFTRAEGHLTGTKVTSLADVSSDTHVFLCGPTRMVEDLSRDLRRVGVPREYLHAERFEFR